MAAAEEQRPERGNRAAPAAAGSPGRRTGVELDDPDPRLGQGEAGVEQAAEGRARGGAISSTVGCSTVASTLSTRSAGARAAACTRPCRRCSGPSPSRIRLKSWAAAAGRRSAPRLMREQRTRDRRGLLDHHPLAHPAACATRASRRLGDDDALAGGEAVVLHDVRRPELVERGGRLLGGRADERARSGTPAAAITSLANALEPSSCAAAPDGPKHRDAARRHGVGDPGDQRRLGPDDDQVDAEPARPGPRPRPRTSGRRRAGWRPRRCPGCPGGCTSVTPGSRDRARASACSRPPVPMTRVLTAPT